MADHLSRLEESENGHNLDVINEVFLDEQLFTIIPSKPTYRVPWYADFVNYLVSGLLSPDLNVQKKRKVL